MIVLVKDAINKGYTVMWDADVSNKGFQQKNGLALNVSDANAQITDIDMKEEAYDATTRQRLYENLTTQDDHLMHLVGVQKIKRWQNIFCCKKFLGKGWTF